VGVDTSEFVGDTHVGVGMGVGAFVRETRMGVGMGVSAFVRETRVGVGAGALVGDTRQGTDCASLPALVGPSGASGVTPCTRAIGTFCASQ
jgi:hypothetical protein